MEQRAKVSDTEMNDPADVGRKARRATSGERKPRADRKWNATKLVGKLELNQIKLEMNETFDCGINEVS